MLSSATIRVRVAYMICFAVQDIAAGEQLLYDYGDRRRETVVAFPWLLP